MVDNVSTPLRISIIDFLTSSFNVAPNNSLVATMISAVLAYTFSWGQAVVS